MMLAPEAQPPATIAQPGGPSIGAAGDRGGGTRRGRDSMSSKPFLISGGIDVTPDSIGSRNRRNSGAGIVRGTLLGISSNG